MMYTEERLRKLKKSELVEWTIKLQNYLDDMMNALSTFLFGENVDKAREILLKTLRETKGGPDPNHN